MFGVNMRLLILAFATGMIGCGQKTEFVEHLSGDCFSTQTLAAVVSDVTKCIRDSGASYVISNHETGVAVVHFQTTAIDASLTIDSRLWGAEPKYVWSIDGLQRMDVSSSVLHITNISQRIRAEICK